MQSTADVVAEGRGKMASAWWLPLAFAATAGVGGYLASTHFGVANPVAGIFGCTVWTVGASGSGVSCARGEPVDVGLGFAGSILLLLFAGQMSVPGTMLFGVRYMSYMGLALTPAALGFWLGVLVGRSGTAERGPARDSPPGAGKVWTAVIAIQAVPVLTLLAGLLIALLQGRAIDTQPVPYLLRVESFPLMAAIYAALPWALALGIRPMALRRLVVLSNLVGIAATCVAAATYFVCSTLPR